MGGKTGSAQIFDFATRHYTHTYNGSFIGFAPLTNPSLVVVVTLNGTHGTGGYGGRAAAPVFHAVATEALRVLDVPKDLPDEEPPKTLVAKSDDADDDVAIAVWAATSPNILEDAEEDDDRKLHAEAADAEPPGPTSPQFPRHDACGRSWRRRRQRDCRAARRKRRGAPAIAAAGRGIT